MLNDTNRFAYGILMLTALFWAGNAIAGKLAVGHITPMTLTGLRWCLAFAIMLVIGGQQFRAERAKVVAHLPLLFAYGAIGFGMFNIALYTALNYTSAINVTIEQSAVPALIFIANFVLFRQRVSPGQIIGFSLSLIGVALVASQGDMARLAALEINRGDAFMGLAALFYASYSVALRFKPELHWKTMMVVMAGSAALASIPFSIWELTAGGAALPDTQGWLVALYAAILPSIFAQVFFMKGVGLIGANRAGLFVNLVPVLGTGMAVVILGEMLGWHHGAALTLVLGGIALAEASARRIR